MSVQSKMRTVVSWIRDEKFREIGHLTGKGKWFHILDFLYCILRHGTRLEDYLYFGFYVKNGRERSSYATYGRVHKFFSRVNARDQTNVFVDKIKFMYRFSSYVGRETFHLDPADSSDTAALEWLRSRNQVFVKPTLLSKGRGVTKISITEDDHVEKLLSYCKENDLVLFEDVIEQHDDLSSIHPDSLNTIRFITLVSGSDVEILGARLRLGRGLALDNLGAGGIVAGINVKTGIVDSSAFSKTGERFDTHPITGLPIKGLQIPFWSEVIAMCKAAALEVPEVRCVGWDVGVTPKGPVLVEGNDRWCRFVWQLPAEHGLYPMIQNK